GLAMQRIGYDRDIRAVADSSDPVYPLAARASWHDVLLDREADLLTVPPGTALDLGATAKAHLADLAALVLSRRHRTAVLVEIGGDLAVHGNAPGWNVLVAERASTPGQLVLVRHGGLGAATTPRPRAAGRPGTAAHAGPARAGSRPANAPHRRSHDRGAHGRTMAHGHRAR